MLDINLIRSNPDKVKQAIAHKRENAAGIDQILELDAQIADSCLRTIEK